ncbi:MAG: triose-phosphate isomerase [bacterium]|nr:triose-phosphate isomerase [bacterium]
MAKLIVANWKMNPGTFREAKTIASSISKFAKHKKNVEVVVCPPFIWLADLLHESPHGVRWGAQNVFWEDKGAFTGEVSPAMIKDSGAEYVIIGHSERRHSLGETDVMINKKIIAALRAGLRVILCVGEPTSVRKKGLAVAKRYVMSQLHKDLHGLKKILHSRLIIAYEPIWAIGTGKADKPEDTIEMTRFIKSLLLTTYHLPHSSVLYGGSVNGKNAQSFLRHKDIDGALVGGASLKAGEFKKIIKIAEENG